MTHHFPQGEKKKSKSKKSKDQTAKKEGEESPEIKIKKEHSRGERRKTREGGWVKKRRTPKGGVSKREGGGQRRGSK